MSDNSLEFTAIRGIQAANAYYVIMVPLKVVPRLFQFEDEAMGAAERAQRVLNRARVPAIASYITNNPGEYILSSLCASIDGEIEFQPAAPTGALRSVGRLRISMDATILINDGQHRRAAIEEALRERPLLGDETISVVVFADRGLKRSQQMFADLNIHAVRPTKSIKLLYDHRDALAGLTRSVVKQIPLFRDFTCLDTSSISNRSIKLFTLSSLHQATAELVGKMHGGKVDEGDLEKAVDYWTEIIQNMPDWQRVGTRQVAACDLRRDYVHAHGVAVQAIATVVGRMASDSPKGWRPKLQGLRDIDWSRSNRRLWDNRALVAGKVNKSKNNIVLVANVISKALGVPLPPEAQKIEDLYAPVAGIELEAADAT
ncbi:DNA sulfur modification protein DndB [Bradyrhizobium sp. NDS-1]|uniref:DNA sulfur modification protein DndB n=1 Tax=Bradyrhizobium sp. NDS-1 TaxID=3080014 RepID=UPI00293E8202|nr:DNA sulfur modification protein DndB [Bradyrhizobium sp. NDS-1]WOH75547.1 DNA sulfur modification protein DndB [Bradyrhizobium sp. NDS-1]